MATFMSLPTELRLEVLKDLLEYGPDQGNSWYPVMLASRKLHSEVTSILSYHATLTVRITVATILLAGRRVERDISGEPQSDYFDVGVVRNYFRRFSAVKVLLQMGDMESFPDPRTSKKVLLSFESKLESQLRVSAAGSSSRALPWPGRSECITVSVVAENDPDCCYTPAWLDGILGTSYTYDLSLQDEVASPWRYFIRAEFWWTKMDNRPDAVGRLVDAVLEFEHGRRQLAKRGQLRMQAPCERCWSTMVAVGWELET